MSGEISPLHQDYRDQKVSPLEVCQQHLREAVSTGSPLNAFADILTDEALYASEASAARYRESRPLSVLDGIPVTIKDLFHVQGTVTGCGSQAAETRLQTRDAVIVDQLKKLGAVIFGKTNLLEYAYGLVHPEIGPARNPWDMRRTIGGSSSGSAAAVAAGLGLASIGTDTAGSIRNPAAFGGVVGFKPTYGRLSAEGLVPLSPSLDHVGLLARSVSDVQVVFDALSTDPKPRAEKEETWRVAVTDLPYTTPEVTRVFGDFIEKLQRTESLMEGFAFDWETANAAALTIISAEAYAIHADHLRESWDGYSMGTRIRLAAASSVSARDYMRARQVAQHLKTQWRQRTQSFDILLLPTLPMEAPFEEEGPGDDLAAATLYTSTFALLGVPAVSVPVGLTVNGLPVGLQIVGHVGQDQAVLEFAKHVETIRGEISHAPLYARMGTRGGGL